MQVSTLKSEAGVTNLKLIDNDEPTTPPESADTKTFYPNPNLKTKIPTHHNGTDYLSLILSSTQVYDVAIETPLQLSVNLSNFVGSHVYLKREDMQEVFSFKLRGAFNRMSRLSPEELSKGVIACSAGNHAQGVALSAKKLGIKATIVMPLATPPIKTKNVKRLGAEIVLHGQDFTESQAEAKRLSALTNQTLIPPFDDPYVIAGQGTIAPEIFRQIDPRKVGAIFVCIGGGGLAAGVSVYTKRVFPGVKVIGVETYDANAMTRSLIKGEREDLDTVGLFADGAAVRSVGKETFNILRDCLDGTVLVSTDEICASMKHIFDDTRSIVEPAGALGVTGCKKYLQHIKAGGKNYFNIDTSKSMISVCSGANINFDRLRFVAERADLGENKEMLICVMIPEKSGSFLSLYNAIHPRNVTEFAYRYGDSTEAHIIMSFNTVNTDEINRKNEIEEIRGKLNALGMKFLDISKNEMAKTHARYMVGGRKFVPNERLFRFSFPERPNALNHFLTTLYTENKSAQGWNISLWHYRNQGGDYGRVMVGIQVPESTNKEFDEFLQVLGYQYIEETENEMYKLFLK